MEDACDSSSSSIDSSGYVSPSSSTNKYGDLSTELSLGVGTSAPKPSTKREQHSGWPPIRSHHRSQLAVQRRTLATFFIKVYMEGVPIGRKLDLFTVGDYAELIMALGDMFKTRVFLALGHDMAEEASKEMHVLTYEDKEGDWMMVGDVPWEIFLSTVKRLKITRETTLSLRGKLKHGYLLST